MMRRSVPVWLLAVFAISASALAQPATDAPEPTGCLACHQGIEPIREAGSEMMEQILEIGRGRGDEGGCTICHGGSHRATEKEEAHGGAAFYPDPGSPWVNEFTCGRCHLDHTKTQWHSLMMTEAGKIHGVTWAFGGLTGYEHKYGNYDVENPADPTERIGTEAYLEYMQRLKEREPQVFVDRHVALPAAPTDPAVLLTNPNGAALTYLRNQCLRCHHAVKGRQERGDHGDNNLANWPR